MRASCIGIAGTGAVFSVPVAIAFKLLSTVRTGQTIIGFTLYLFRVGVPPSIPALVGAEPFGFSALYLHDGFSAPKALYLKDIFRRVAAHIRTDGVDGDVKGKRNVHGGFATAAHDIQDFDFMLGHI